MAGPSRSSGAWPFLAGTLAGLAAAFLVSPSRRRRLDRRILRALPHEDRPTPVVFVPGLMGSQLLRPDGTQAWLNLGNTLGHHHLGLPRKLPFSESRDDLRPGLLIGTDNVLPRAFGFTEYADLIDMLDSADYEPGTGPGRRFAIFPYDWRRDLVETARRLDRRLEALAATMGDPDARFHLVGHSMGGLVVRYYLRFGGREPTDAAAVGWDGARRTASAILVATPSAGAVPALGAILGGERVGFSYTTLAASVVARMPSIYQMLPASGTRPLCNPGGDVLEQDVLDPATWERFGWGPFSPATDDRRAPERAFVKACLARARAFQAALARPPQTPCPVPVYLVGGDCLPTLARAVVGEGPPGQPPRFEARSGHEQDLLYEPGDGRVTRASLLADHLPDARDGETGSGIPEVARAFFGGIDHHAYYSDPAIQSLLLRLLLRASRKAPRARVEAAGRSHLLSRLAAP
jgi:pimeloyl-ACP methyl ester carboxylesterase